MQDWVFRPGSRVVFILTCFIAVGYELLKLIISKDVLLLFLTNMKLLIQVFDDLECFAHLPTLFFFSLF